MNFWYFKFEGWFADDSLENPGQGVFSECLVAANNLMDAEQQFYSAMENNKINLLNIEDNYPINSDPESMDPENPDSLDWIEWCEETELAGKPTFGFFHLYPASEVDKSILTGN